VAYLKIFLHHLPGKTEEPQKAQPRFKAGIATVQVTSKPLS